MIRYVIGWFNKRTGGNGYYSTTYKTQAAAHKARDRHNRKHLDRAHGIVARMGGRDGR